jgi:hypothetical protein
MTCATTPVFWARQPRLPQPLQRFVRVRLETALRDPQARALLVWPTILGAPKLREAWPEGVPETELLTQAGRMLASLGVSDPAAAWHETLRLFPDTADKGATGWVPQRIWEPLSAPLSLRCGVILLALTGQPEDERYRLASAVTLFNSALFHETHDALEERWVNASGDLKRGLQGLILIAGGFYHQQHHDAVGMMTLWKDALSVLSPFDGEVQTPWGTVDIAGSIGSMEARIDWVRRLSTDAELDGLWELPRPEWGLK